MGRQVEVETENESFDAEVADNFFRRAKGLSFRSKGKMLFVFPRETRAAIDMVFLSRPLWLYFIGSEKNVLEVQKAEPWSWNPRTWKLYRPEKSYRYLLESFHPLEIEEGEGLEFEI